MVRQCAWCGRDLGDAADPADDGVVSHGLCASCEEQVVAELAIPLERFVRLLNAPVVLVDPAEGTRVVGVNQAARQAMGREPDTGDGETRVGDVFECVHAREPEGCGRSIHCSGCTIRRAVEETWESGEPRLRIPATLQSDASAGPASADLEISTERVGDSVLLRVDRIRGPRGPG